MHGYEKTNIQDDADLIVLNADPLEDISVLTKPDNIQVVIIDGNIVKNE